MRKGELCRYIDVESISILDAIQKINKNTQGILFITDVHGRLTGSMTDGDVRRYLLNGGDLGETVRAAMFDSPKYAHSLGQAKQLYHEKNLFAIPIVDQNQVIVDCYFGRGIGKDEKKVEKEKLNMPVVINAGGKGSRLDPYTRVLPKPLIPVGDIPIIEHIMDSFTDYGCDEFHIIINYKKEIMKAYFHESEKKYKIHWYAEETPLGTGGGLSLLKGVLRGTFFFTNCDILVQEDYGEIYKFHKKNNNLVTIVCANKKICIPYGVIETEADGKITGMKEKPDFSILTNTGLYVAEAEFMDALENNKPADLPEIIESERLHGKRVAAYTIGETQWMDMGQITELEEMRKRLYDES